MRFKAGFSDNTAQALMIACSAIDVTKGEPVHVKCRQKDCVNMIEITANHREVFGDACCNECVEKYKRERDLKLMEKYWKKVCPAEYRSTDLKHETWNKEAWDKARQIPLSESLVIIGESGQCKTRIACERAKRAILTGKTVSLMWPDELKEIPRFTSRKDYIQDLCKPDYLLLDDAFLCGSKEAAAELLKDIIDKRIREQKATVITTQISGEDWKGDAAKFKNMTKAENDRIDAVVRRVKEKFRTIDADCSDELPEALF
jgi:DNA replication protein DnaC